jgi:prevent-host-death family protein
MKVISIAEAKNSLTKLIHQVEEGEPVHLTRRGSPVAVILSEAQYQQLTAQRKSVWVSIKEWRDQVNFTDIELTDEEINSWRDRSTGRDFSWEN